MWTKDRDGNLIHLESGAQIVRDGKVLEYRHPLLDMGRILMESAFPEDLDEERKLYIHEFETKGEFHRIRLHPPKKDARTKE